MATGSHHESDDEHSGDRERRQDPLVRRLRPDPARPPEPALTLAGLLGDSDRHGFRRLYFSRELDYYAEFRDEDVLDIAAIPPEEPPFLGEEASRVTVRRDAAIDYTRTRTGRPIDEFDLDIKLARVAMMQQQPWTQNFVCQPQSYGCEITWPGTECHCPPDPGPGGTEVTECAGPITICRGYCDPPETAVNQATCRTCETCRRCETWRCG